MCVCVFVLKLHMRAALPSAFGCMCEAVCAVVCACASVCLFRACSPPTGCLCVCVPLWWCPLVSQQQRSADTPCCHSTVPTDMQACCALGHWAQDAALSAWLLQQVARPRCAAVCRPALLGCCVSVWLCVCPPAVHAAAFRRLKNTNSGGSEQQPARKLPPRLKTVRQRRSGRPQLLRPPTVHVRHGHVANLWKKVCTLCQPARVCYACGCAAEDMFGKEARGCVCSWCLRCGESDGTQCAPRVRTFDLAAVLCVPLTSFTSLGHEPAVCCCTECATAAQRGGQLSACSVASPWAPAELWPVCMVVDVRAAAAVYFAFCPLRRLPRACLPAMPSFAFLHSSQ